MNGVQTITLDELERHLAAIRVTEGIPRVVVGGNAGVYEGTIVRRGAVLGAGVVLTRATPVYDLVRERVIRGGPDAPLEIPEDAVVVGGARAVRSAWGSAQGLSIYTPVIVKYRDEKTDLATALEGHLR